MFGPAWSCESYCADVHLLGTARTRFPGIVGEMKDQTTQDQSSTPGSSVPSLLVPEDFHQAQRCLTWDQGYHFLSPPEDQLTV